MLVLWIYVPRIILATVSNYQTSDSGYGSSLAHDNMCRCSKI